MLSLKLYLFYSTVSSFVIRISVADCHVDPYRERSPLLIKPGINSNDFTIIYPEFGMNTIRFDVDDIVEFACPEQNVVYGDIRTPTTVMATCTSDGRFEIMGKRFFYQDVSCSSDPISVARFLNHNSQCGTNAKLAEVGFDLGRNRFLTTILICFNTFNEMPSYSRYTIPSTINFGDNLKERPFFTQDEGFYKIRNVDHLYTRGKHRATINQLVGLPGTSTKYIKDDNRFLSRGHLAAKKDFFYKPAQSATFRLINAAPQWQSFNGYNWNQVEIDTRNYASDRKLNLEVWTGTYGVDTLPHENNHQEVPLSLYGNGNLPVPALFWKIVYDSTNNKGIVLIGLNNPYKVDQRNIICSDISSQVNWLNWDQSNVEKGYSYACTVGTFKYAVKDQVSIPREVPDLDVSDLLL